MSYEFQANFSATGVPNVEKGAQAVDAIAERTKKLNDALYGQNVATEKLTLANSRAYAEELKLEQLRERHRMQTEALSASTTKAAASQEVLAASTQRVVGSTMAASTALRVMEGAMPLRAAASFLSTVQGLGPALQLAFPIFGAIALAEVFGKIAGTVDKWYDKYVQLKEVQEDIARTAKELASSTEQSYFNVTRMQIATLRKQERYAEAGAAESGEASSTLVGLPGFDPKKLDALDRPQVRRLTDLYRPLVAGDIQERIGEAQSSQRALRTAALNVGSPAFESYGSDKQIAAQKEAVDNLLQFLLQRQQEFSGTLKEISRKTKEDIDSPILAEAEKRRKAEASYNKKLESSRLYDYQQALAGVEGSRALPGTIDSLLAYDGGQNIIGNLTGGGGATLPGVPAGYTSPQEALRNARRRESQGVRSANGDPDQIYSVRLKAAQEELAAQLRIADLRHDDIARVDAIATAEEKLYQARIEHERAIEEMVRKQREEFVNNSVGLIHAAATGHAGGWFKGRLESIGDQILGKAAGAVFDKLKGAATPKTVSIGDVLGSAAKDAPEIDNTNATKDNTDATRDLTDAMRVIIMTGGVPGGGSGGSAGGGGALYGFPGSGPTVPGGVGAPGALGGVAKIGAYAGAAFLGYQGVRSIAKGGAQNAVSGIGEIAGAAALVDPEPISKAILAGVAVGSGIVASIMGDPHQKRENYIARTLETNQYRDPVSINASMTTGGGYADYDRFGGIRGSSLSPYPTVEQGYYDSRKNVSVPGRTLSQFGGGAPPITINVQTIDSRSFNENAHLVAGAVNHALVNGHATDLQETLRSM